MQLKSVGFIKYLIITVFLFSYSSESFADTSSNIEEKITRPIQQLPRTLLYSGYFQERDKLTWNNIKEELYFKLDYFKGRRPVKNYVRCHRFQRRITKFISEAIASGALNITEINNDFLFKKGSDFEKILSIQPPPSNFCNFHSYGDLKSDCIIYCDYHGIDYESKFFKEHQKELEAARPIITSEDVAELIIFSPTFAVFVIVLFLLIPKKRKIPLYERG